MQIIRYIHKYFINRIRKNIFRCNIFKIYAVNVSKEKYFGVTILTDVLRGRNTKRIYENCLHLVKEFGALKDLPHDTVVAVIDWMISEKLILKTKGKYPVLHSTYEGLHYSETVTEAKLKRLKKYLEY